jgi:predicted 3-demethylubiquinone-9 3-methyltransferase (glyoxalase superfamily)
MQKIMPCLWFDNQAEEAAKFYVSLLKNSKIIGKSYYTEGTPGPVGSVMTVEFQMNGQRFLALNGGPIYKFTEAVSFMIYCDTQREIDTLWKKLTAKGGMEIQCGWLRDRYGLSWQICPSFVPKILISKNKKKVESYMKAMMTMKKLDIKTLKHAFDNPGKPFKSKK